MFHYLQDETAARFAKRWSLSWPDFLSVAVDTVRTCLSRGHQRQELLDYLAVDHRAAADIGMADNDAREWARRPFWRP
jgi:uncharacterized protein YjiS (DUF1127 family)